MPATQPSAPASAPVPAPVPLTGWGRTAPSAAHVVRPRTHEEAVAALRVCAERGGIARGLGRAYGDAAQNAGGAVLDMTGLDRVHVIDADAGTVVCDAGVSLHRLMEVLLPLGWFVPVTPGTRYVTVGGAMGAGKQGKNTHVSGSLAPPLRSHALHPAAGPVLAQVQPDGRRFVDFSVAGQASRKIYGDPGAVTGGFAQPVGIGRRVDGGRVQPGVQDPEPAAESLRGRRAFRLVHPGACGVTRTRRARRGAPPHPARAGRPRTHAHGSVGMTPSPQEAQPVSSVSAIAALIYPPRLALIHDICRTGQESGRLTANRPLSAVSCSSSSPVHRGGRGW